MSNAATGNLLEGAAVELARLGLTTLTDRTGNFVLTGVPDGTHEIVASYTGLDPQKFPVTVSGGQRAIRDFDLTSRIYRLDAFKVSGEREGTAAAITAQRNADNVKNVVAMDTYGNLPNMNATELALRLPGVSVGILGLEPVEGVSVRGMPMGMNTITIDGGLMASFAAMTRQTRMTAFTGAMFESLELIKGHTPDKGADSLGGTINLKTRSPLSMREKRRIGYMATVRIAPSFTEQIPMREARRSHPLYNASWQEKFSIFGSEVENFAVSINWFHSENVFGWFQTTRDFQNTLNTPAYVWDYRTTDGYNSRKQTSVNTKFEFRLSQKSKITFNFIGANGLDVGLRRPSIRAFTGNASVVPNATTSGIVPGFTDRITQVRPVPGSIIDVTSQNLNTNQRLRQVNMGGEHEFGPWSLEWGAQYSVMRRAVGDHSATLINRLAGVGWILDRTESDLYPRFNQTGGPDFTDPSNYRPQPNGLSSPAHTQNQHLVKEVHGDAKYKLPFTGLSLFLKTGGSWREQSVKDWPGNRRWSYIGTTALPTDPSIVVWDAVKTGRRIPLWDVANFAKAGQVFQPELWREDLYFREQIRFTGTRGVTETVAAGYVMTQGKFGKNGFLAGVRTEKTDTRSFGWVRQRFGSTVAQQQADPIGAAQRDYASNRRELQGSYTKSFPSIHLWRNLTPQLKGRLSWSTSFGRPSMINLLPNENVSETAQTVTINNPSLLPQVAANWDATLEYYFEPSGSLTFGWFHKTIKDFIVSGVTTGTIGTEQDNGYNGEYGGFTKLGSINAGTAFVQGWEFSYMQQLSFLPGLLKGLSLNVNLTLIDAHGDFGGTPNLPNDQLVGLVPKTGNVSLSWRYERFSTRILYNYSDANIRSYSPTSPARNDYMMEREVVNLGFAYELRPTLSLHFDVANLFNEPARYYRGIPDRLATFLMQGTTISAGVTGRF